MNHGSDLTDEDVPGEHFLPRVSLDPAALAL